MTSTSPITSLASQAAMTQTDSSSDNAAALASTDSLGNENTFLQLLVAQIQNQDPTQPIDSSTFLSQLAEFSQLEQLIAIQGDVSQLDTAAGTSATGATNTTNTNNTTNS